VRGSTRKGERRARAHCRRASRGGAKTLREHGELKEALRREPGLEVGPGSRQQNLPRRQSAKSSGYSRSRGLGMVLAGQFRRNHRLFPERIVAMLLGEMTPHQQAGILRYRIEITIGGHHQRVGVRDWRGRATPGDRPSSRENEREDTGAVGVNRIGTAKRATADVGPVAYGLRSGDNIAVSVGSKDADAVVSALKEVDIGATEISVREARRRGRGPASP